MKSVLDFVHLFEGVFSKDLTANDGWKWGTTKLTFKEFVLST